MHEWKLNYGHYSDQGDVKSLHLPVQTDQTGNVGSTFVASLSLVVDTYVQDVLYDIKFSLDGQK